MIYTVLLHLLALVGLFVIMFMASMLVGAWLLAGNELEGGPND